MGMYSSLEGTNVPSSQNGLPNVSQFGWTSYEMEEYKQLIEYVNEAKQYADQSKQIYDFLIILQETVENLKSEIDGIKIDIDGKYDLIVKMTTSIEQWFAQISTWQQEVKDNTLLVSDMLAQVQKILVQITAMREEVSAMKDAASQSEANAATSAGESLASANKSEEMFNKCYELYEALRKGQVYRGIWNPHSGAYPDPQGTNSVWDVVLNENEEEFEFDGKRWFWGDRVYYLADDSKYYQIESGTNVKSVNGKTGAVVLSAKDVGALPSSGAAVLQGNLYVVSDDEAITMKGKTTNSACYFMSRTSDDSPCWFLGKGGSSHDVSFKSYVHDTELQLKSDKILVNKNIFVGENQVYHWGNNPTADAVGTYTKAVIDQKDDAVKAMFSDYNTKIEVEALLNLKADKTTVTNQLSTKVDKTTTVNGQPLSGDITITADDPSSVKKAGDVMTGTLTAPTLISKRGAYPSLTLTANTYSDDLRNKILESATDGALSIITRKQDGTNNGVVTIAAGKNGEVYHTGNKPTPNELGAADATLGSEIKLLTTSNSGRTKEVQIFSKEGRLYAVSADGTKTQFYNDRTYRPTLADFGGLAVENGNELNISSSSNSFLFGYRQSGGSAISDYYFCNGKAQANQYANVHTNNLYANSSVVTGTASSYIGQSGWKIGFINSENAAMTSAIKPADADQHSGIGVHADGNIYAWNHKSARGYGLVMTPDEFLVGRVLRENGQRVYSPGNKPTLSELGMDGKSIGLPTNLGTEDLDTLKTAGVYAQHANVNTSAERHYPENLAGCLFVTSGAGVQQRYHVYNTSRIWTRAQYSTGGWTPWAREYNTQNKPTPAELNAVSRDEVNFAQVGTWAGTINKIPYVGGNGAMEIGRYVDFHYNDSTKDYDCRFNVNADGSMRIENFNGYLDIAPKNSSYCHLYSDRAFYFNQPLTATGAITSNDSLVSGNNLQMTKNGRRHIVFHNGTSADGYIYKDADATPIKINHGVNQLGGGELHIFRNGGMLITGRLNNTDEGEGAAGLRCTPPAGGWADWRARASALQIDCPESDGSATNIWKATQWGARHIAAMQVHWGGQGFVKINVGNSDFTFQGDGTFVSGGNGNFNDVYIRSDRRLKTNLIPLEGALDKVQKLTAYHYDKKLSLDAEEYTEKEVGLIAQDLEEVLPEAVNTNKETTLKTISNSSVNALLVEAVKELRQEMNLEIEALKAEISALRRELREVKGE